MIDENGVILAGNATVEAAKAAGLSRLRVIEADGAEVVAVRRSNLTETEKTRLALYDNRAGELATWDAGVLASLAADGIQLTDGLWTPEELASMLGGARPGLTDPDIAPEPRPTSIRAGEMFELGPHRIICGSATDPATVARVLAGAVPVLMVTDPPYGIEYDPTWRNKAGINRSTKKSGKVLNDDQADWTPAWDLFPGDVAYVYHAGLKSSIVQGSLERARFTLRAQIIWAKDRMAISRGDYHWQHEPIWYGVREGRKGHRTTDRRQTTLWRIETPSAWPAPGMPPPETSTVWEIEAREDAGHGHGTQKPVECMARPMRNHAAPEVYEPFSGSGTTIIAGQQLGRRVYAVELNPTYVQMAIDRWEAFTGKRAVKVAEAAA